MRIQKHVRFMGCLVVAISISLLGCDTSQGVQKNTLVDTDDPVVQEFPIAYVQRPLPLDEDGEPVVDNIFDPVAFNPGAQLVLKLRAEASAPELILTEGVFPANTETGDPALYDVKDLAVSPDGRRLAFAMRAPEIEGADDDEQPTWNIWEYDLDSRELRKVIDSDIISEAGQDVAPQYLDDGRIVFSSTRQSRSIEILVDDLKPQYAALDEDLDNEAFVLHVMDPDGANITQVSYNASHDLQPTVLSGGEVVYLRWDNLGNDVVSLYKANEDGSNQQAYYGYHSQNTGTNGSEAVWTRPIQAEDGRLLAILRPLETERLGGDIVSIDTENFIDSDTPIYQGGGGEAQQSLSINPVEIEGMEPSLGGTFSSVYPLYDGTERLLVSWSQCRLIHPIEETISPCTELLLSQDAEPAPLLFGLWIYDPMRKTQLPVKIPQEGTMFTNAVVMTARVQGSATMPSGDTDWIKEEIGVVNIRSVYDRDGQDTAPGGISVVANPALTPPDTLGPRFIRIVKAVAIPDDDVLDFDRAAFGRSRAQLMREILGYVPIEPDGSARFKVPADVPVMLDMVDASGKRIGGRHQNWLTVRPGEERQCTGCHSRNSQAPHGRLDAEAPSVYAGASDGVNFANTRLLDVNGIPEPAPAGGQTMAEYYTSLAAHGPRTPSVDLLYEDAWTDPSAATPGSDINARYIDIFTTFVIPADQENDIPAMAKNPADANCAELDNAPPVWTSPTACVNAGSWDSKCRITINYLDSIHPLWEQDRRRCDAGGNLIEDLTCTSCHGRGSVDMLQVPAGQLELTGETSQDRNDYITSYAELMFQDNEQEVVENSLTDRVNEVPTGEFETDADGNLILDEFGNPIEIIALETIPVPVPMSTQGARASNRFFSRFETGGSHEGYLTSAELKLIAEWLDIGGQYYNNPFDAPAD